MGACDHGCLVAKTGINRCVEIAKISMPCTPSYLITHRIANCLIRIEAVRQSVIHLTINLVILASNRELHANCIGYKVHSQKTCDTTLPAHFVCGLLLSRACLQLAPSGFGS